MPIRRPGPARPTQTADEMIAARSTPPQLQSSPKELTAANGQQVKLAKGFFGKPPLFIVLYGPPGIGKTSFCSHFPNPYFVIEKHDKGVQTLAAFKQIKQPLIAPYVVDGWEDTLSCLHRVALGHVDCGTVVLESLSGMERFCFAHHCRERYNNDFTATGFYSFQQGPKSAARHEWPNLLDKLSAIHERGINVIFTAHSDVKTFNSPDTADYDKFIVNCEKNLWFQTYKAAYAVLYYHQRVEVSGKEGAIKKKVTRGSESRHIACTNSAAFDAKNQYGLPDLIDAGDDHETAFTNFANAILGRK